MVDGKSSSGGNANAMPPASSYGFLDLQGSMQVHQPLNPHGYQTSTLAPPQVQDVFNLRAGSMHQADQTVSFLDYSKGERGKNSLSDDDEINCTEEVAEGHNETSKSKKGSPWQRVKWTDKMVMLLITAVSYIGEDASSDCIGAGRRKACLLQKKGKWKTVSNVMAERGFYVSPQQCEDKFNDLNKRYKRLNDVLGRGTSCEVVENPVLLDLMDLPDKTKEDVRKILSSKHLFYEQMCSYHNGNRLHLPRDPDLQRSLQLALKSKEDYEPFEARQLKPGDFDEDDQDAEADDRNDDMEGDHSFHQDCVGTFGFPGSSAKQMRHMEDYEEVGFANSINPLDCNKRSDDYLQNDRTVNLNLPEGSKSDFSKEQWMTCHSLQLEEQKLMIQEQMLDLEKQQLKWQKFCRKQEKELDEMRLENKFMKLENERMALELKHKELKATLHLTG